MEHNDSPYAIICKPGRNAIVANHDEFVQFLETMDNEIKTISPFMDNVIVVANASKEVFNRTLVCGKEELPVFGDFALTTVADCAPCPMTQHQVSLYMKMLGRPEGIMLLPGHKAIVFHHNEITSDTNS